MTEGERSLVRIIDRLTRLLQGEQSIMANLDELTAAVTRNNDVGDSAVTLLNGLAEQLRAAANDPTAIAALSASLTAQADEMAAAIVANTTAAVEPAPVEPTPI